MVSPEGAKVKVKVWRVASWANSRVLTIYIMAATAMPTIPAMTTWAEPRTPAALLGATPVGLGIEEVEVGPVEEGRVMVALVHEPVGMYDCEVVLTAYEVKAVEVLIFCRVM